MEKKKRGKGSIVLCDDRGGMGMASAPLLGGLSSSLRAGSILRAGAEIRTARERKLKAFPA